MIELSTTDASENICEPLIASVEVDVIRPAATLVMVRSAPTSPTLTVLVGLAPAKLSSVKLLNEALEVPTAACVFEPAPSATSPAFALACAPLPIATLFWVEATAAGPTATLSVPMAWLSARVELAWKYLMPPPLLMLVRELFTAPTAS